MPAEASVFRRERASDRYILPIKEEGHWTIMLEELEFAIETDKLDCIARLHNEGDTPKQISSFVARYYPEVMMALMHLAMKGKLKRPIAVVQ
jgi:hypothetical protein